MFCLYQVVAIEAKSGVQVEVAEGQVIVEVAAQLLAVPEQLRPHQHGVRSRTR
jgi:hypothetical protein